LGVGWREFYKNDYNRTIRNEEVIDLAESEQEFLTKPFSCKEQLIIAGSGNLALNVYKIA
jgi:hypothetical protein